MQELITQEAFAAGLRVFLLVAFGCAWLGGLVIGFKRGAVKRYLTLGGLLSLLCPLTWALWRLFTHLVRYNPTTGEAGLHKVSVFLLSMAIFIAVGASAGFLASRIAKRFR